MARLHTKVKLYLEANSKTWKEEKNNIIIQNDSDGKEDYIAFWNVSGLNKPTNSQLNSYDSDGDISETLNKVLVKRQKEYPSIEEQMDMQYWDKVNGTSIWQDAIAKVKSDNPKE